MLSLLQPHFHMSRRECTSKLVVIAVLQGTSEFHPDALVMLRRGTLRPCPLTRLAFQVDNQGLSLRIRDLAYRMVGNGRGLWGMGLSILHLPGVAPYQRISFRKALLSPKGGPAKVFSFRSSPHHPQDPRPPCRLHWRTAIVPQRNRAYLYRSLTPPPAAHPPTLRLQSVPKVVPRCRPYFGNASLVLPRIVRVQPVPLIHKVGLRYECPLV